MTVTENEITSWVKTYTNEMLTYTLLKVNDKQTAEDIVQSTFLSALEGISKFEQRSNPKTWLFSILKNKIADFFRQKFKKIDNQINTPSNEFFDEHGRWNPEYRPTNWGDEKELLDDPEFSKALYNCFEKLPQKWSSAVQLKFLEEYDRKVICTKLEITTTNFWQIIHRAKLQLRNCLELKWFKK